MNVYKTYTPDGKAVVFNTLSELRSFFDLSAEDTKKCFCDGVHTVAFGIEVITYRA